MTVTILQEMLHDFPKEGRLLGVDPGTKTLGLALSTPDRSFATPYKTLHRTKYSQDVVLLREVVDEYGIVAVIMGYPLNMDGSEGGRAQSVRDLSNQLSKDLNLPVALQDERLSTASVDNFLINSLDKSRKKRKQVVDALAAQVILDDALRLLNKPL